jgi:DNA polymerase-3 subunit epsilon
VQKIVQGPMFFSECKSIFKNIKELKAYDFDTLYESVANMKVLGFPLIELSSKKLALETTLTPFEKQRFCIVDIETNGSKPDNSQIIELGAIMYENGKIVDKFESYVKADEIPKNIVQLTGITLNDVKNAPSLKSVLEKFRLFLSDAVFLAHNVNFDYKFISHSMEEAGFGPLLNRKICSIDLAKKTIEAEKYGLGFLIKLFDIKVDHHRAYSDAYAAMVVFEKSLENLPDFVITTEDLITFANPNPKKRKKKKEK